MLSRNLKLCCAGLTLVGLGFASLLVVAEPPRQQSQPPRISPDLLPGQVPKLSKEEIKKQAEAWRKKFPFESVAKRLAYEDGFAAESKDRPAPKLSDEAAKHLEALEVSGQPHPFARGGRRTRALAMLHSEQVEQFISREGFGVSRMPQPSVHQLELADAEPVRYPRYLLESTADNDTAFRNVPKSAQEDANPWNLPARELLFDYHLRGQLDFAGPLGLGLVRGRDQVAGFRPHQFRDLPQLVTKWEPGPPQPRRKLDVGPPAPGSKPVEEWVLRRLELVSLLKHKEPAVYISATLPKMDDLADAPTRKLSGFEADSLKSLRTGESLVARAKANHLEMFGALRAAKQCQQCHQVQRGELLGAFSYELHRTPEFKPAKEAASGG